MQNKRKACNASAFHQIVRNNSYGLTAAANFNALNKPESGVHLQQGQTNDDRKVTLWDWICPKV